MYASSLSTSVNFAMRTSCRALTISAYGPLGYQDLVQNLNVIDELVGLEAPSTQTIATSRAALCSAPSRAAFSASSPRDQRNLRHRGRRIIVQQTASLGTSFCIVIDGILQRPGMYLVADI